MGGQRHSKNAGTMGVEGLTYHEKKALGFGTVKQRLGKDSVGNYYDCRLTLQPAVDPVCTPEGYLFSKEAIIESLIQQKKAIKRKHAAWEAQQADDHQKVEERNAVDQQAQLLAFDRQNHMGASDRQASNLQLAIAEEADAQMQEKRVVNSAVNIAENKTKMKEMKAFWVPSQGKEARQILAKPDEHTYCPASGKKLRLKDLIPVRFTRVPEEDSGVFMDPVTKDNFTNASSLVVLKATGKCVCTDCQPGAANLTFAQQRLQSAAQYSLLLSSLAMIIKVTHVASHSSR
ncbi:TPA: hypothetical protein ACH3X1_016068 [Trebouxia sp. C0004]